MNGMKLRAIIVVVLLVVLGGLFLTGSAESHVCYSETRVGVRSQNFTQDFEKAVPQNPEYISIEQFLTDSFTSSTLVIQKEFDSTHLAYFGARYYDPTSGRFTNPDPFMGHLADPRSQFIYGYGYNNPLMYVDTDGESATAVCAVGGFFWGFGQMVYGMGKDIASGTGVRTTSEYLGLWGQNAVGGLEIGASIDVTLMSGGTTALMGSGALGLGGFEALTLSGEGDESLGTFAKKQALSGAIGAVGGPLLARGGALLGTMAYGGLTKTLGKKATTYAVSIAEKGLKRGSEFVARYAKALDKAVMDQFSRKAVEKTTSRFFPKPPAPRYRFNLNNRETTLSNTTISANTPKIIIADAEKNAAITDPLRLLPERPLIIGVKRPYDVAKRNRIPGYDDHHLNPPLGRNDPRYKTGPTIPVRNDNARGRVSGGENWHTGKGGFQTALNDHIIELGYTRKQWNSLPESVRDMHLRRYYASLGIPYP